jgi:hypothetical protein
VFGKTSLSDVLQQAIKQFNSPPSIAEKWVVVINKVFKTVIMLTEYVILLLFRSPLVNNPKAQQFVESFLTMAGRVSNKCVSKQINEEP